jgi:hypothetical protein
MAALLTVLTIAWTWPQHMQHGVCRPYSCTADTRHGGGASAPNSTATTDAQQHSLANKPAPHLANKQP